MAAPTTALDALVAELLGDVGKLHAEVKALGETVPAMAGAVASATMDAEKRLEVVVSKLENQVCTERSAQANPRRWQWLLTIAVVGALGGIATLGCLRYLSPATLLSGSALETYRSGQWLEQAWPRLNAGQQEAIKKAADGN